MFVFINKPSKHIFLCACVCAICASRASGYVGPKGKKQAQARAARPLVEPAGDAARPATNAVSVCGEEGQVRGRHGEHVDGPGPGGRIARLVLHAVEEVPSLVRGELERIFTNTSKF